MDMKHSNGVDEKKKSDIAKREEDILAFWKKEHIFEKTLAKEARKGEYVFYDGPPFATGLPHHGSLLSSIIKDVIPRYKTMRGYRVARRWGWDCHGLPIENLIEKRLGLKTKKDIEKVGVGVFNKAARESVLEFADEWKRYVERIGRFVDFDDSYKTMDNEYIESVWWGLKKLNERGYLYEGKKVLMYCPRCETPLAKAEIAMDHTYQDLTEEAVTAKFHLRSGQKFGAHVTGDTAYVLAWTTTPWTLPGNVALAVGKGLSYTALQKKDTPDLYIVASERVSTLFPPETVEIVHGDIKGEDLIGLEYEPLYPAAVKGKKYVVIAADFVTTEEGTGIVHIAPAYGEDDFAAGQKEKLPVLQLLDQSGRYTNDAPEFIRGRYLRDANAVIADELEKRGLLFARAKHTHSYPHCYRCGTPLIYNAVASWFINIQKIKAKMLAENERITWVPEHLKHGRFKHIIDNAPDWTISRNRYWASPLPIWRGKKSKKIRVIGSVDELLSLQKRSGNRYFLMRHGKAKSNGGFIESKDAIDNPLTPEGEAAVRHAARSLAKQRIDLIVASPLKRAQQTAHILQQELGLPESAVMTDERLREIDFGDMNGKPVGAWDALFKTFADRFSYTAHGGETYKNVWRRVGDFLFDVERRYTGKSMLMVSHGTPLWFMKQIAQRRSYRDMLRLHGMHATDETRDAYPKTAEWTEIDFVRYPRNEEGELDLHRPYIDDMQLKEGGEELERVPEVVDCWVESGSMPFAQNHYLGKALPSFNPKKGLFSRRRGYPADFIAEYIAQTRTWFYYMHVMGALLFSAPAFANVVSTGTVLAADGAKMSKSKGNFTDPLHLIEQYGADAYRLYLMGSVVMQAEDVSFRDEEVREVHNRVLGILSNSYTFFELYKEAWNRSVPARGSEYILDRWVFARLDETTRETTAAFDAYDLPRAVRALRSFVEDYSTWYVRRSRDRVKGDDEKDKQFALATQRDVLLTLSKLVAPLAPFIAERMYQGVAGEEMSVHLAAWPTAGESDTSVLPHMQAVRAAVSRALEARNAAGIKVRQPLASLSIRAGVPGDERYLALIRDEVNVREVKIDPSISDEVALDTTITAALKEEGMRREAVRAIQGKRKAAQLLVSDRPKVVLGVPKGTGGMFHAHAEEVRRAAQLAALAIEERELSEGTFEVHIAS